MLLNLMLYYHYLYQPPNSLLATTDLRNSTAHFGGLTNTCKHVPGDCCRVLVNRQSLPLWTKL